MKQLRVPSPHDDETARRIMVEVEEAEEPPTIVASTANERSHNTLRPMWLDDLIGQDRLKALLRRLIDSAEAKDEPLDHTLLVASSGYGKTTVANVIANELGVEVFQQEAPVSHDMLLTLRGIMQDRDILFIDEIHQQGIMDRRNRDSSTQPEVLFSVMEDRTIVTDSGVLPFPKITVIGATTDEGRLPDAFINRFPIRPEFDPYTEIDLGVIADLNADALGLGITTDAALRFAWASRGIPRIINNYVRNAAALVTGSVITEAEAIEVINDLNRTTDDGLTLDMQKTLIFLYEKCQRTTGDGDVVYQASLSSIATVIGKSRDVKAVQLRVEPYLIEQGYLQVGHGGRKLTDLGVARALDIIDQRTKG